ncbi:MAG: tRNA pseudouridine(55) synthase TruB [Acholeplasma sp.]|nr:MAG: tRNA pseudouridine(55) synthase TruB [Acholeplasma sp.]
MDGFLLINKPVGWTSHDVVSRIKRQFHFPKVGHTGTLDPFASGLLILCLGKATKLAYLFSELDKIYTGTILFGVSYDTLDTTGKCLETRSVNIKEEEIIESMQSFIGTYAQIPPMFSALKVEGKKLYDLARQGIEITRDARDVMIYEFIPTSPFIDQKLSFLAHVSKGTYIRTLAYDLAQKLGNIAALESLHRLSVGSYSVLDAKTIEDVTTDDIITLDQFFKDTPCLVLNDYMIRLVQNGVYLDQRQTTTHQPFIVKDEKGHMIAYYTVTSEGIYAPVIIF